MIGVTRELRRSQEYELAKQLIRSGTAVGANVEEAIAAESRRDFISKMSIALKEARETLYWLRLLRESQVLKTPMENRLEKAVEVVRILSAIVNTSKASL